jgi:hypothetical protein
MQHAMQRKAFLQLLVPFFNYSCLALGDLPWDVPNASLWPTDEYAAAVRRLHPDGDTADSLLARPAAERPALPWDVGVLAAMSRLRAAEWRKLSAAGGVPM